VSRLVDSAELVAHLGLLSDQMKHNMLHAVKERRGKTVCLTLCPAGKGQITSCYVCEEHLQDPDLEL